MMSTLHNIIMFLYDSMWKTMCGAHSFASGDAMKAVQNETSSVTIMFMNSSCLLLLIIEPRESGAGTNF
jgi:hypothetical protein